MVQLDALNRLTRLKSVRSADFQLAIGVLGVEVEPVLAEAGREFNAVLKIECFGSPAVLLRRRVTVARELVGLERSYDRDLPVIAEYVQVQVPNGIPPLKRWCRPFEPVV